MPFSDKKSRIRESLNPEISHKALEISVGMSDESLDDNIWDIKERWNLRRRSAKKSHRSLLTAK